MNKIQSPRDGFVAWLPGELVYSAEKKGYDEKIKRAHRLIDDPTSIYGFLSGEWFNFRLAAKQGAHYQPSHGKSGQSQLAKFAAGLFDKVALGRWMVSGAEADPEQFKTFAQKTADEILKSDPKPWEDPSYYHQNYLANRFEDTPFHEGVIEIMRGIVRADQQQEATIVQSEVSKFSELAITLGGRATALYLVYAISNLTLDQHEIPKSELA